MMHAAPTYASEVFELLRMISVYPFLQNFEYFSGAILPMINGVAFDYLLETLIAREVLEVWQEWHEGRVPSPEEMCQAVIYYAEHDAYLPE